MGPSTTEVSPIASRVTTAVKYVWKKHCLRRFQDTVGELPRNLHRFVCSTVGGAREYGYLAWNRQLVHAILPIRISR